MKKANLIFALLLTIIQWSFGQFVLKDAVYLKNRTENFGGVTFKIGVEF